MFWRSVNLTGNQTDVVCVKARLQFWRSVNLTGNQTTLRAGDIAGLFWRSVNLTGNQTGIEYFKQVFRFGAVSI